MHAAFYPFSFLNFAHLAFCTAAIRLLALADMSRCWPSPGFTPTASTSTAVQAGKCVEGGIDAFPAPSPNGCVLSAIP